MEILQQVQEVKTKASPVGNLATEEEKFKPTGAIAFFVLLVILGLIIWYSIYFLMLSRA